ncbi:MAG: AEC family transporter [Geobacteraceae bacterium]|nr:AEC family transporter [Geobacteraceae bacterium]
MLAALEFAFLITAPVFFIIISGVVFKRMELITDAFARTGSDLVFKVTLPCLLFVKLVQTDFQRDLPWLLIGYALLATIGVFILLEREADRRLRHPDERGVFVQGAFRGNMGIVGLAYCFSAFGDSVVAPASIYLAVMTTLYNVLAVLTLTRHQNQHKLDPASLHSRIFSILASIGKNPLILAIIAGVGVSVADVWVPQVVLDTGEYLAQMSLPLALVCAGASIRLREFTTSRPLYAATLAKLVLVPLGITLGGIALGLRGEALGILYLMSSAPTAAASYPMTLVLGGSHHLAAAIIAATAIGSLFSTTLGLFILRSLQLI